MELLTFCLTVSLATVALHVSILWPNMIFSAAEKYLIRLPLYVRKPLYECLICMCSVWTITAWLLCARPFDWHLLFAIFITGGINTLFCIALNQTDYGC